MKPIYIVMPGRSFDPDADILRMTNELNLALDTWNQDKGGRSIFQCSFDLSTMEKVEICVACGQVVENDE